MSGLKNKILAFIDRFMALFYPMPSTDSIAPKVPVETPPTAPILPPDASVDPDSIIYAWDTPQHCYHNVRVICDLADLKYSEKNLICACIYQESRFNNKAIHINRSNNGMILSTDYGIAQINDYWHIGAGKDFPSTDYVLANPDKVVEWMVQMYKDGLLKQWVSYSSGAYKQWLVENSPMWGLAGV